MTIGFDLIPVNLNTPGVYAEFDPSNAQQGVQLQAHDVLIAGQSLAGGSAVPGTIYAVASDDEAVGLFGATSQLRAMVRAYKDYDSLTPVFACAAAADSGTAATGDIIFAGTATESGEIPMYIGGRRVAVPVAVDDTGTEMETAALAALTAFEADANSLPLPVTYAANVGTGVDFTAVHEGVIGNQIILGVALRQGERLPAGITAVPTAMASGATDPSYAGVITAMGEDQYHTIVSGLADATVMALFETEQESRWGPMRAIDGQVFGALYDTRANLTTAGNARNSFATTIVGAELNAVLPLPWELAAQSAAADARQAQTQPARALTGLSYVGFTAAPRGSRFTRAERDILLSDGISTVKAGSDGRLRIERFITTWQTNASAVPDESYKDLFTLRTLSAIRFSVVARISSKYGRFLLTGDDDPIPPGADVVNAALIRTELINLYQDWLDIPWVEAFATFKEELVVERESDNRVNVILPPDLINNLLITGIRISYKR